MKVILTQDVRGQGKKGQLIDAAEGYARNFLLPRKLAVLATADAINTMNLKEKARRAEEAANRQAAVEMGGKLKNVTSSSRPRAARRASSSVPSRARKFPRALRASSSSTCPSRRSCSTSPSRPSAPTRSRPSSATK